MQRAIYSALKKEKKVTVSRAQGDRLKAVVKRILDHAEKLGWLK